VRIMAEKLGKDIEASLSNGNEVSRTVSIGDGSEKRVLDSRDVDAALNFLESHGQELSFEDINEKKLMRKVDIMLMPLMFVIFLAFAHSD
jgi:hypothetical protein